MNDYDQQTPRRKKSLGQHFLNSGRTVNRIIDALETTENQTVIEIGPGRGALTRELVSRCGRLILVEKDAELIPLLTEAFSKAEIIEADATQVNFLPIVTPAEKAVVVGNLPYNVAGRILFNLLSQDAHFERLVLMFQKEVAERFCAKPGDRDFGAASLLISLMADVRYLFDVSQTKFIPPPKVMSGVVLFCPANLPEDRAFIRSPSFMNFVHALFAQPRKKIANSMMDGLKISRDRTITLLSGAGVNPQSRPNELTGEQAVKMFQISHSAV